LLELVNDKGMDRRLDEIDRYVHHPATVGRLSGRKSRSRIGRAGGELGGSV